jgi:hypothetical protein
MGVDLVNRVRNFSIESRTFSPSDHDVQDGSVTPATHKLLRFDFLSHNAGDADLVIDSSAGRPDLSVWSAGHGHYHLKNVNEFLCSCELARHEGLVAVTIHAAPPSTTPSPSE